MAASTRIKNCATSSAGLHLANATRYVILAQQEVARAKAIADAVTGGGVTQGNLDTAVEFGVPGAGVGAVLYPAIANFNTNLATVTSSQLANLDPG